MSINVFLYDSSRNPRPTKNLQTIRAAADESVNIKDTTWMRGDQTIPGVEDLLLGDTFDYDALIVHADARYADDALAAASLALEMNNLPADRLIIVTSDGVKSFPGARYVEAHGGNGYMTFNDAKQLVDVLRKFEH